MKWKEIGKKQQAVIERLMRYSGTWILSWRNVNESYDTVLEAGKEKSSWCDVQATKPSTGTKESSNRKTDMHFPMDQHMERFVWLHIKEEFCGPAIERTTSLASCNLLWLQFHLIAVGCEELSHRPIMVEGFALMKNFGFVSRSYSSCVFFQPRPDFKTSSFSKYSSWIRDFFPPVFFSPLMISHKEERKRGWGGNSAIVWIILHHPQKGDPGLRWIRKSTQIDWCWFEVTTSKSILWI